MASSTGNILRQGLFALLLLFSVWAFFVNYESGMGCEIKYADLGKRIFKLLEKDERFKELKWLATNGCDGLSITGTVDSAVTLRDLNNIVEVERSKLRMRYFVVQPLDVNYGIKISKNLVKKAAQVAKVTPSEEQDNSEDTLEAENDTQDIQSQAPRKPD